MILDTPDGTIITHPTADDVCKILRQEDAFWNQGSGTVSLSKSSNQPELMIFRKSDYGYVVLELDSYKALIDDKKDKNTMVVHHIGGEPFPVPSCFYINFDEAKEIVLHYLNTGEMFNYERWQDIYDDFDGDAYYESEEYYNGTEVFEKNHLHKKL